MANIVKIFTVIVIVTVQIKPYLLLPGKMNTKLETNTNQFDTKKSESNLPEGVASMPESTTLAKEMFMAANSGEVSDISETATSSVQVTTEAIVLSDTAVDANEYSNMISNITLRELTVELIKLCPVSMFCGIFIKSKIQDSNCCLRCSCDVNCHVTNSCCPHVYNDIAKPVVRKDMNETCMHAIRMFTHNVDIEDLGPEFLFVTSCPDGSNPDTKRMCEVTNKTFALGDITPVSDVSLPVNYRNRYCAKCHDVDPPNTISWEPDIRCSYPLQMQKFLSLEDEVAAREDCHILFQPPKYVDLNATLCVTNVIKVCNVTGKWEVYDTFKADACEHMDMLFRSPVSKQRYSNVFCALCNGDEIVSEKGKCTGMIGTTSTIFRLLVSVELPQKSTIDDKNQCGRSLRRDPLSGSCKPLHCIRPLQLNLQTKQCASLLKETDKALFTIPLRIKPQHIFLLFQINAFRKLFEREVNRKYDTCDGEIYLKTDVPFRSLNNNMTTLDFDTRILEINVLFKLFFSFITVSPYEYFLQVMDTLRTEILVNITIMNDSTTSFEVMVGQIDAPYQLSPPFLQSNDSENEKQFLPLSFLNMSVFEDPYDKMSIVTSRSYSGRLFCQKEDYSEIFTAGHMGCPSFVYELEKNRMSRGINGITYGESSVFDFGEFRSINQTHVLICADSVLHKLPISGTSNLETTHVLFVIFLILFQQVSKNLIFFR